MTEITFTEFEENIDEIIDRCINEKEHFLVDKEFVLIHVAEYDELCSADSLNDYLPE